MLATVKRRKRYRDRFLKDKENSARASSKRTENDSCPQTQNWDELDRLYLPLTSLSTVMIKVKAPDAQITQTIYPNIPTYSEFSRSLQS